MSGPSDDPPAPAIRMASAVEAIDELRDGRPIGLRHREGYSLIAPARIASGPFVAYLEATAGAPVELVLAPGAPAPEPPALTPADGTAAPAGVPSPAARAARVHEILRGEASHAGPGRLAVVEADPAGVLGGGAAAAGLELVRAAGLGDGALLVPIARGAAAPALPVRFVCISDVAVHVARQVATVQRIVSARMPTSFGDFEMVGYRAALQGMEFVAAVRGDCAGHARVPVSVHDGCLLGGTLRGSRCACRERFVAGMARIGAQPRGIVIRLEADGLSLVHHDRTPDPCRMALVAEVIRDLGPVSVTLVDTDEAIAAALAAHDCPVAT